MGAVPESGTGPTETIARTSPALRWWGRIVGLVVVGLIGWWLWSLSASTEPLDALPAVNPSRDETEPADVVESTRSEVSGEQAESKGQPDIETVGNPAPVLGEIVQFDLLIGTSGRPSVLDLDSGQVQHFEGNRVVPHTVTGRWLLVLHGSRTAALGLEDLAATPTQLSFGPTTRFDIAHPQQRTDGSAWLWLFDDNGVGFPELALVDVATSEIVERGLSPQETSLGYSGQTYLNEGPMLLSALSGGVYELSGGGFVQVADGRLVAADESRALVETCDRVLRCAAQWLDRRTWGPMDLMLPQEKVDGATFLNGTDWLWLINYGDQPGRQRIFNVTTGQLVEIDGTGGTEHDLGPAVSPDGRWLATVGSEPDTIQLLELDSGNETRIGGLREVSGPLLFVGR